jgi:RNA polymerase sigma factor for flagellar operon FliA
MQISAEAKQDPALLEQLPMVRAIARRIHKRIAQSVDIEDLFSSGLVGLMEAHAKFDPAKKCQFSSFARFRIQGAILDYLRSLDWAPRGLRRRGRAVGETIQTLSSRLGRRPSEEEIAAELNTSLSAYQKLLGDLDGLEIVRLRRRHKDDSDEEDLVPVPSRPEDDPLFICMQCEMRKRLARAIEELSERERLVITLSYYKELTRHEISLVLRVSEMRVYQIHVSAVSHLRSAFSELSSCGPPKDRAAIKSGR